MSNIIRKGYFYNNVNKEICMFYDIVLADLNVKNSFGVIFTTENLGPILSKFEDEIKQGTYILGSVYEGDANSIMNVFKYGVSFQYVSHVFHSFFFNDEKTQLIGRFHVIDETSFGDLLKQRLESGKDVVMKPIMMSILDEKNHVSNIDIRTWNWTTPEIEYATL